MLRKMGNKLERIEEEIFEGRGEEVVRDISNAKQEIINFRKIIRPQRAVLRDLERTKQRYLADDLEIYFDDINDASERIWDMLENYKEVVEALEDTNESVISHRVNEVLRVLTAFSVVILPLTLLASIFGMNVGFPFHTRRRRPFWAIIGVMVGARCAGDGRATSAGAAGSDAPGRTSAVVDPSIFKAYDVRGTYPDQMDEDVAYRIGPGVRPGARPSWRASRWPTCAWRSGATCASPRRPWPPATPRAWPTRAWTCWTSGWSGTEMLYWTVGSRDLDGGLMCTASHNPKAYTGAKLVRQRRARALGRLRHRRAARPRGRRRARARRRQPARPCTTEDVGEPFRAAALEYIDAGAHRAAEGGAGRRQRHGGADGGPAARLASRSSRCRPTGRPTASSPTTSPTRCSRRTAASSSTRCAAEGADLGIAWDGDADRCFFIDDTGAFVDGDFLTALLAESLLEQGARRHRALRRARLARRARTWSSAAGGTALVNRVGHAFFKTPDARDGRRLRRRGLRPLLLPRLLLRRLGHASGAADPRAAVGRRASRSASCCAPLRERYFISGEINSEVEDQDGKMRELAERYCGRRGGMARRRVGGLRRLALQRPPVEHRAAAAPEPRVARLGGAHGREARRGARPHPG